MSISDVIKIHNMVISRFGGLHGTHNQGLLESAINHPWMMIEFGNDEDGEIHNLAAAYFFHIIKNHPFVDGNKRTDLLTALQFFIEMVLNPKRSLKIFMMIYTNCL